MLVAGNICNYILLSEEPCGLKGILMLWNRVARGERRDHPRGSSLGLCFVTFSLPQHQSSKWDTSALSPHPAMVLRGQLCELPFRVF